MATNDGGPAFPGEQGHIPEGTWNQTWDPGMSLRDYFAAKALQVARHVCVNDYPDNTWSIRDLADCAYELADAMLAAREVKP